MSVCATRTLSACCVSYVTTTCGTTLMVTRPDPATLWCVRAAKAAFMSLASALYHRYVGDLCPPAIPRLSTGLRDTCGEAPARGVVARVSQRAGGVLAISSSRRSPLATPAALPSRPRTRYSSGSMPTAPLRNRGFCTVVLRRGVRARERSRILRCIKTSVIASAAAYAGARTRMASSSACSTAHPSWGQLGSGRI